jgi:uncharacterized membrane-anchored protein
MVVADTIGAIAVGGGQALTWLVVLLVTFFVPSALISAALTPIAAIITAATAHHLATCTRR